MPLEYFDDGEYYYTDEEEEFEEGDDDEEYYDEEEYPLPDLNPLSILNEEIIQQKWQKISIGANTLMVSNHGKIFINGHITLGDREIGSPYRYISIKLNDDTIVNNYVHDIVWRTFNNEPIFDGWEVRHLDYTEMDTGQCYVNHIDNLQICKKTITRDITDITHLS
jgi:hypothetical protein